MPPAWPGAGRRGRFAPIPYDAPYDASAAARDEALRIMKDNPKLKGERGEALRCLLYLYERDEAVPLIGAG